MVRLITFTVVLLMLTSCSDETPPEADDSGNLIPRPKTVEQLTQRAKLIVVGTILDVQQQRSEGPLGGPSPGASGVPSLPAFAFTYYTVRVDSVVAGTEVKSGQQFTLRVNGLAKERTQSGGEMMMPQPGDSRLFVLETDPLVPNAYFPAPWGIFDLSGPVAKFDDVRGTSVDQITNDGSRSGFVDTLRATVGARP